jgi:DinB superfamily
MRELGEKLLRAVDTAEPRLRQIRESESTESLLAGGWSRKQLMGHLIDSASNNHQRFVRAALQPSLDFPGYDQAGNVRVQAVQEAEWTLLVSLWAAYNRYLAHVIAHLPASRLDTPCRIGAGEAVTLRFLATDYLRHLLHHLNQAGVADDFQDDIPESAAKLPHL